MESMSKQRAGSIIKELKALECMLNGSEEPSNLTLPALKYITNDFSKKQKIGGGGCGEVYKGILPNGAFVAVKKLFNNHTIDERQFRQEVQSMMMVEHPNIVCFIGYCSHTEQKAMTIEGKFVMVDMRERLLCFEYIRNGSLDNYLTDELRGLEWYTRYKIIKGICEGLHHLHKEKGIIHMDLKPANVLLDDHMEPKIADFGISRFDEKSYTKSDSRLCSPQYCAPEYRLDGKMSLKSDVFSLGVIIIELVTGSKEEPDTTNVLRRWRHRWKQSSKHSLLEYKQLTKCIELALRCLDEEPLERPFIWDIIDELNQIDNNANSNETTIDQVSSCLEEMLGIEPLELHFAFKKNRIISCKLQLTNETDDCFAFRIEAMNPLQYCIEPIKGVVPPGSKCSVTIMTQTRVHAPEHKHFKDAFTLQSTRVDGCLTAMSITKDVFSEKTERVVDKVNLTVVFDTTPIPEEPKDLSVLPEILQDEVGQGTGKASDDLGLCAPKVLPRNLWSGLCCFSFRCRRAKKVPSSDMLGSSKHEEEPPTPKPQEHRLSPMAIACSRIDLPAIHQILVTAGYKDDDLCVDELSFQQWTTQMQFCLNARRVGDNAFGDKVFEAAIERYTAAIDEVPGHSIVIYARRSLCHLMCDQPEAAFRDAVLTEFILPGWPTALYLKAVALSELNMQSDAMNMFNEGVKQEEELMRKRGLW